MVIRTRVPRTHPHGTPCSESGSMNLALRARRCLVLLFAVISCAAGGKAARTADSPSPTGGIEGTVTYRADPQRPWRYGRYYIKQAKTGELAEAVVAIRMRKSDAASAPAAKPKSVTIDQKNFQFVPETVVVRKGDSVTFTNSDGATHNVRASGKLAGFNITIAAGETYTNLCDKAGGVRDPIQIGCVFHSAMQAWIFVFDHPYFQMTGADGRFRLEGIPAGEYELELAHPAGGLRWKQQVVIQADQTLQVDIPLSPDDKK